MNDKIIIIFSGMAQSILLIPPAEFNNFINDKFPDLPVEFFSDSEKHWYQAGMDQWNKENKNWNRVSSSIDESVTYLTNLIQSYKEIYFLGVSSGGYMAILMAYLINISNPIVKVKKILTYIPQTYIDKPFLNVIENDVDRSKFDTRYLNLADLPLNDLSITIHGDSLDIEENSLHHIDHCRNLYKFSNIEIIEHSGLNMKEYRDSGDLYNDFLSLMN